MNNGHRILCIALLVVCATSRSGNAQNGLFGTAAWKQNAFATTRFEINGTESRNNPIRRGLDQPFSGEQLFVRFYLRYDAKSIDLPSEDEGEFVVLWLDATEGNDASTHSGNVPNVGIHVSGNTNRFMVRFQSKKESYAAELKGDCDYLVVARLWKSESGDDKPFDQLSLWVDPTADSEFRPHANVENSKAIASVGWLGFSTGAKTEVDDRVFVWDVDLKKTWKGILRIPDSVSPSIAKPRYKPKTIDFDTQVHAILRSHCFDCHAGEDADIRLDIHDEVLNLCAPGDANGSRLFQLVAKGEMPPEESRSLSKAQIATLRDWIDEGVDWNDALLPTPIPETEHWSFQPIARPKVPMVANRDWIQTPVDAFIARKHQQAGIRPAKPADKPTLRRRMTLDLLGLPESQVAIEPTKSLVDQLLSHPAYGQRWGRHWLDVARWAESNGHQHNRFRPHAWRYRDWVVDAFNGDLPFDQFIQAQVSGVLPTKDALVATGFLAATRYSGNELDKRIQRNDILVDVVNTTANAFLGLTFECAQCHTHKFDPISLRDYYRMQSFFADGQPGNVGLDDSEETRNLVSRRWEIFDRTYNRLVKVRQRKGVPGAELVIPKTVVAKMSADDQREFQQLENQINKINQAWAFYSAATTRTNPLLPHEMRWPLPRDPSSLQSGKTHMLLRGDINAQGPEVSPGWPLVFGETPNLDANVEPRVALANWLSSSTNPLTARVWVNRIWAWHFGTGLVRTVEDFGVQGSEPSHPELLDFLAIELIENDWSTNHIHRLILNSSTYQQSTSDSTKNRQLDPENQLYWRWSPRRLEAEAIRDCMLSVSNQLDLSAGGPSVPPNEKSVRRSLYLRQHRERFPDHQTLFDSADGLVSCSRRRVSTNALQPMWLLNSDFAQSAAKSLADRVSSVEEAFEICLGRKPTANELTTLQRHRQQHGLPSACLVIMNTSEFLYIP